MDKRVLSIVLFLLVSIFWGSSFPVIKIGLSYSPPMLYVGIRCFIAGVMMIVIAGVLEGKVNFSRTWRIFLVCSLFNVVLFQGLQGFALNYLPSGLTAVVIYLQPVFTGIIAWLWLNESMTIYKVVGLFLGVIGVISVSFDGSISSIAFSGLFVSLLAAISWAVGTVYFKSVQDRVPVLWLVGIQFFIGGITLIAVGSVFENWSYITWNITLLYTIIYTSLFTISLAWAIWLFLLRTGESSRVASYNFLTPFVSVLIGVVFLGETITISFVIGVILICLSIYLVNRTTASNKVTMNNVEDQKINHFKRNM